MPRLHVLITALVFLLGASALPAYADSSTPSATPTPPSRPGDPFGGQTPPPGPIFVITPSDGSSTLPSTSRPEDLASHLNHDRGTSSPTPGVPSSSASASVPTASSSATDAGAGPQTGAAASARTDSVTGQAWAWWVAGVAALLVLVGAVVYVRRRNKAVTPPDGSR